MRHKVGTVDYVAVTHNSDLSDLSHVVCAGMFVSTSVWRTSLVGDRGRHRRLTGSLLFRRLLTDDDMAGHFDATPWARLTLLCRFVTR